MARNRFNYAKILRIYNYLCQVKYAKGVGPEQWDAIVLAQDTVRYAAFKPFAGIRTKADKVRGMRPRAPEGVEYPLAFRIAFQFLYGTHPEKAMWHWFRKPMPEWWNWRALPRGYKWEYAAMLKQQAESAGNTGNPVSEIPPKKPVGSVPIYKERARAASVRSA